MSMDEEMEDLRFELPNAPSSKKTKKDKPLTTKSLHFGKISFHKLMKENIRLKVENRPIKHKLQSLRRKQKTPMGTLLEAIET